MYLPHKIMMFPILCYILPCHLQNIGLQKRHSTYTSDYQLTNPTNGWNSLVQENKNMVGKSLTVSSQSVTLNILWISSTILMPCQSTVFKIWQYCIIRSATLSSFNACLFSLVWWLHNVLISDIIVQFSIRKFSSTSDGVVLRFSLLLHI